jgi:hypothetical protein
MINTLPDLQSVANLQSTATETEEYIEEHDIEYSSISKLKTTISGYTDIEGAFFDVSSISGYCDIEVQTSISKFL